MITILQDQNLQPQAQQPQAQNQTEIQTQTQTQTIKQPQLQPQTPQAQDSPAAALEIQLSPLPQQYVQLSLRGMPSGSPSGVSGVVGDESSQHESHILISKLPGAPHSPASSVISIGDE